MDEVRDSVVLTQNIRRWSETELEQQITRCICCDADVNTNIQILLLFLRIFGFENSIIVYAFRYVFVKFEC